MALDLNSCLVRNSEGVDLKSTLDNVATAVASYNAAFANDQGAIATAVASVFDQYKGARITMPALTSLTLNKLVGIDPSTYSEMAERVGDYVRSNAATETTPGLFAIGKGKGGGVARVSDMPVKA